MTNFTKDRTTGANNSYLNLPYFGPFGLAASQVVYAGCMYAVDASGRPVNPGSTTAVVVGVAMEHVSNVAGPPYYPRGAGVNDGVSCNLRSGVFAMDLHGTHPPTIADLWKPAYASDNHTISRLATDGSYAGVIVWVDGSLVYIYVAPFSAIRSLDGGLTAMVLTENTAAIGGTNDGDLPDLTATYVARTGAGGGTADGAYEDEGTLATAGGNTYSDAAANLVIGKLKNNVKELATVVAQLAADNVALRAGLREVAANSVRIVTDLA